MIDPINFDVIVLLRHVSILSKISARRYTWDELGESLMAQRVKARSAVGGGPDSQLTPWQAVKRDVFRVLATDDPEFAEIRRRIAGSGDPSTIAVLSTLSLWLAGRRGISTSLTTPIIGTLLYGIATSPMGYAAMI
jgi:hypothetical protein